MTTRTHKIQPLKGWAIYLRTSDKDAQNPENSQQRQRHAIEQGLLSKSDLPVLTEYVDNLSGRYASNREGYQRMLSDARAGRFSHVAVENAERFGRNDAEALPVIDELHRLGVSVRFADYPDLNPVDPDDRIMVSLSFTLARRESIKTAQRVKGGMHAKLRGGGHVGPAPDGYINRETRTSSESTLDSGRYTRWIEIDPKQGEVWRYAWELLLSDRYTLKQIAEELHACGYRFRSGKPFVKIRDGKRIPESYRLTKSFRNWTYAGWVASEKAKIPPKTIRGNWEALIPTADFERGLAILNERTGGRKKQVRHQYLLQGLIWFKDETGELCKMRCATINSWRKSGGTPHYRIQNTHYKCADIDAQINAMIAGLQIDPELIPVMREHYTQDLANMLGLNDTNMTERIEKELQAIDREEERILRLYVAGNVSEDIWNKMWLEWQDRRHKLRDKIDTLKSENTHYIENLDAALTTISKISVLYDQLDMDDQKLLIRDVLKQVVIDAEGQVIKVEFRPPFTYLTQLLHKVRTEKDEAKLNGKGASKSADSSSVITRCVQANPFVFYNIAVHDVRFRKGPSFANKACKPL